MYKTPNTTSFLLLRAAALTAAVLVLSACNRPAEAPAAADSTSPAAVAASSPDPHAAIVPESANANATVPETGPAEGGTAIGGMVAGQGADQNAGQNEPRNGGASEPTGGDGATTQAATPPVK